MWYFIGIINLLIIIALMFLIGYGYYKDYQKDKAHFRAVVKGVGRYFLIILLIAAVVTFFVVVLS